MRYTEIRREIAAGTAAATVPRWARHVLDDIAAGRVAVEAVRHPLGFLCLPVERTGDLGVCLHIWTPEVESVAATTSGVHCHSWELVSFVLYGEVRNTRARVADVPPAGADGATHRVFEVVSRGEVDELKATGRTVRYAAGDTGTHGTGAVYTLPAGVFHSTFIEGGPDAATVALGRQDPDGGDLSLGPLGTSSHQMRRLRCDPDETARAALRSARRIEAAHPALPEPEPSLEPGLEPGSERGAEPGGRGRSGRTARG
ncbi:hypothetical protein [Actinomadura rugatobispora]|uniref:Cupin n=1 Tax=Actinomadura rugatobispora TaxID=1994 RepID=A0ABW1ADK2_9ACTN|nr:hypothetical protein GCM10010200_076010 [Actinomadura rugatobispora]